MPALESDLRRQLENVIIEARDVAEGAARSALQKRAVDAAEPHSHFGPKERDLRTRLRAKGRQAGDIRNADKTQSIDQLAQELAYEFWHRMLFARFLAENNLLMHPDGVAVSLEECEELAKDADPPALNGFVLAARYASTMLPQIFRTDDVLLEIDFSPEQRLALERLLESLPQKAFLSDDSLGWAYQFWQSKKKEEVNKSGNPIDGLTLSAVTQLFTEHYMVQFLLHNTIGAWWCARRNIMGQAGGAGVPFGKSPVEMEYLHWREDGTPAAGEFEDWPKSLAELTLLDPCCGSGHFLVASFNLLVPLRMQDEHLTAEKACEAVLRDNIFGLELDARCTQIAAFALALAAWKYPDAGGFRILPSLNIACSGQGVSGKKEEWLALANSDDKLCNGMDRLYDLFQQAPHLGSLIDPRRERGNMYEAGYAESKPLLTKALAKVANNEEMLAIGVAAQGITRAAELLAKEYSLVITNVPYLGRGKQSDVIKAYLDDNYADGKADLATAFMLRCLELNAKGGTSAIVAPQNSLFLDSYKGLRQHFIRDATLNIIARLGPNAFRDMNWWAAITMLICITKAPPSSKSTFAGLDVGSVKDQDEKARMLIASSPKIVHQCSQLSNYGFAITFNDAGQSELLSSFARSIEGLSTGDGDRYLRRHWEIDRLAERAEWDRFHVTPDETTDFGGLSEILWWENGDSEMCRSDGARIQGQAAWGRDGVLVSKMNRLKCCRYIGTKHDKMAVAIVPGKSEHLSALWALCSSPDFHNLVREISQKVDVATATLVQIPFELDRWQQVATVRYPNGLPEPLSDDPTQWLFKGDIATSTDPLQVAVARLLGYRWPDQPKAADAIDSLADSDRILCLAGVRGEAAASERLLEVLHAAYGEKWSDSVLHKLLTDAGCKAGTTLDDWLRNQFFEQHCKRFQARPFVWHIWDGRKDGFTALVNYHRLDHKALENLTYSYLGDWISVQSKSEKAGADSRLGAAQELQAKLKLILAGEPPYDIFVRWKPLHEQAIGWNPDLNDGVRMNIRPFVEAGILRKTPNIKWTKDRGKEPERDKSDYPWFWSGKEFVGDRVNDIHLTNAEKQAARSRKKGSK
jgi:hypothetical protein